MPPEHELGRGSLIKAQRDLDAASALLHGEQSVPDIVCFRFQQCVEKLLKSILALHGLPPPRTHVLGQLFDRLPSTPDSLAALREQCEWLTMFAVETRYPDSEGEPNREQAEEAVEIAERTWDAVLAIMPAEAKP